MQYVNELLRYWVEAPWYIALSMSLMVNVSVFVVTAHVLDTLIARLVATGKYGSYIDERQLKPGQKKFEISYGVAACAMFALLSLLTRVLFDHYWPTTLRQLAIQLGLFVVFYETYSYFVHRLLHTGWFIKFHSVHHRSVRVTPWTAYSVHPVEAAFIGMSAPIFMFLFSMSLGLTLLLHIFGMMFTIVLHSNFRLEGQLDKLVRYPAYHASHHLMGKVNFGFIHSFWDDRFKTRK